MLKSLLKDYIKDLRGKNKYISNVNFIFYKIKWIQITHSNSIYSFLPELFLKAFCKSLIIYVTVEDQLVTKKKVIIISTRLVWDPQ